MKLLDLHGKHALVTGGTHALGMVIDDFIITRTPLAKWGNPEDLAETAVFLASKESNFVYGKIVYVDGGILATVGKPVNES